MKPLPHPLPCPFCSHEPVVLPLDPEREGNAWGAVACTNPRCVAKPMIQDGCSRVAERGSDVYKYVAIVRWNRRPSTPRWRVRATREYLRRVDEMCYEIVRRAFYGPP